jgi:hypothetical protein
MSDGPHKSLSMRAGWKKFAKCADKAAFEPEQLADLAIPALEGDWREDVAPHLRALCKVLGDSDQPSLFGGANTAELESLKRLSPGNSLWHAVVDCVAHAVAGGLTGQVALLDGATKALLDRGARGVRQVEEHYLRKTKESRALRVGKSMEEGVSSAPIEQMARRLLGIDRDPASARTPKLQGLDDGVML